MRDEPVELVVTMTTAGENVERFCQRLANLTDRSALRLARVISRGCQIYPTRPDLIGDRVTILDCEFRPRRGDAFIAEEEVTGLLKLLAEHEVWRASLVDESGNVVRVLGGFRVAG